MLKMICDLCDKDCDLVSYDIQVYVLQNPVPHCIHSIGEPKITCDKTHMRLMLCQKCYAKLNLPNIYEATKRDKGEDVE